MIKTKILNLILILAIVSIFCTTAVSASSDPNADIWYNDTITINQEIMLNESFSYDVSLNNTGNVTGYDPAIAVTVDNGLNDINASYLSQEVRSSKYVGSTNESINVTDPITGLTFELKANQTLYIFQYPINSITPDAINSVLHLTGTVDSNATIGKDYNITVTPIFILGDQFVDVNNTQQIIGGNVSATVTPTVLNVRKEVNIHEHETVTGENYPFSYTIYVDVANGITVNDINIEDILPNYLHFINVTTNKGNVTVKPANGTSGKLSIDLGNVTGTLRDDDAIIEFWVYTSFNNTNNTQTLNNDGHAFSFLNNVNATGNFTSQNITVSDNDNVTTILKSLAIQKIPYNEGDNSSYGWGSEIKPNTIITYHINFQVSDYYGFDNLTIVDSLGDTISGSSQVFNDNYKPILNLTMNNTTTKIELNSSYYTIVDGDNGTSVITFYNLSTLLKNITGGKYNGSNYGATYGTLKFQVNVSTHHKGSNKTLTANDYVINRVNGSANQLSTGVNITDSSSSYLVLPSITIEKGIYAINGDKVKDKFEVQPGDNVTYYIKVILPTGTGDSVVLTDYLPIPLFNVTGFNVTNTTSGEIPTTGHWAFGNGTTNITDLNNASIVPSVTINSDSNLIIWNLTNIFNKNSTEEVFMGWFTVTCTDVPMSDQLLLSNRVLLGYINSDDETFLSEAISKVIIQEPELTINKTANSTVFENGTEVVYNLNITNIGHGNAFNVTVYDNFNQSYGEVSRISLSYGNGTVIINSTNKTDYIWNLFNSTSNGVDLNITLSGRNDNNNTVIITYYVTFNAQADPAEVFVNTANITKFSSVEDGTNFVTNPSNIKYSSSWNLTALGVNLTKEYWGSNTSQIKGGNLTIGEVGIFNITVDLPNLNITNLTIMDKLPLGLEYLNWEFVGNSTVITVINKTDGQVVTFGFGNVSALENGFTIKLFFKVLDDTTNNPAFNIKTKTNDVNLTWTNKNSDTLSSPLKANATVSFVEPNVEVSKTFNSTTYYGGQEVNMTITLSNKNSTAYNLSFTDNLTEFINNFGVYVNFTNSSGNVTYDTNILTIQKDTLDPGEVIVVNITLKLNNTLLMGSNYTNTINGSYYSLNTTESRVYNKTASANFSTVQPTIEKVLVNSTIHNNTGNLTIGENVTYEFNISLYPGSYGNLTITDNLPEGFKYTGYLLNTTGFNGTLGTLNFTNNSNVTFKFEGLSNSTASSNSTFKIYLYCTVLNVTGNSAGNETVNKVSLTWDLNKTGINSSSKATIVEPKVEITKLFDPQRINGGINSTINITVKNTGNSKAFNVTVYDDLSKFIDLFYNSTSFKSNNSTVISFNNTTKLVTIDVGTLEIGETKTYSFKFTTFDVFIMGQNETNIAIVNYTSLNDTTTGVYRNYSDNGSAVLRTVDPLINKTIINSTINNGNGNLTIGENLTYMINITFVKGEYDNITIIDNLPNGLKYINSSFISNGFNDNLNMNVTENGQNITFLFNGSDVMKEEIGFITLYINVTVLNSTELTAGKTVNNNASVYWNNWTTTDIWDNVSAKIIEPVLNIVKTSNQTNLNLNDTFNYTITVSHNQTSSSNAYNITITDILPEGLTHINNSTIPDGWTYIYDSTTCTITITGNNLTLGESVSFTFEVRVDYNINLISTNITNVVNVSYYSSNESGRKYNDTGNHTVHIMSVDLILTKTSITSFIAGENVTYNITVTNNGPDNASNVIFNDILSELSNIYYKIDNGGWISATNILSINLGQINASSTVTILINGTLNSNITNGTSIFNEANVTTIDESNYTNNYDNVTNIVLTKVNLTINKVVSKTQVIAGEELSFNITITNNGPSDASNVIVNDSALTNASIFTNVRYSSDNINFQPLNNNGIFNLGNIKSGSTAIIYIKSIINSSYLGWANNTVNMTTNTSNNGTNSSNTSTFVIEEIKLDVVKIADTQSFIPGQTVTYTIIVTNNGHSTVRDVNVVDKLNSNLLNPTWSYTLNGQTINVGSWTGSYDFASCNLAPRSTLVIKITAVINSDMSNNIINTVNISTTDGNNEGTNVSTVTINYIPFDLDISKEVSSNNLTLDEPFNYTIIIKNTGTTIDYNVYVTDIIPNNILFIDNYSGNLTNGFTYNYNSSTKVLTISGNSLNVGENLTFTFNCKVANNLTNSLNKSTINNTAVVSFTTLHGGVNKTKNSTVAVNVTKPIADIEVVKTINNTSLEVGDNGTYTIVVTNNGPDKVYGVQITDIVPSSLELIGFNVSKGYYNSTTGIWNIGFMDNGNVETLTINVTVLKSGLISNLANKTEEYGYDPNTTNDNSTVNITVPIAADIAVSIKVSNQTPKLGQIINYTVTVTNNGPDNATGVNITTLIPDGLKSLYYTVSGGSYNNDTGLWEIGNVNLGEKFTIVFTVLPLVSGSIDDDVAKITEYEYDPVNVNNYDSVTIVVLQTYADVGITKEVTPTIVKVGDTLTYTIIVKNYGPDEAVNLTVKDLLPDGLVYLSSNASQGTYDSVTGIWTIGELENNSYVVLTIVANATKVGTIINTAVLSGNNLNTSGVHPTNASATLTVLSSNNNSNNSNNFKGIHSQISNNNGSYGSNYLNQEIKMQNTGLPISTLLLALIAIFAVFILKRKKL